MSEFQNLIGEGPVGVSFTDRHGGAVYINCPGPIYIRPVTIPAFCEAIYTAAGMTFPTATPDLTAFQTALATLAEKHSSDQSIEMACIALFEEARKVGLLQPEADALDSVRTSLRDISNDPGLSISERDKARRALEAMS